MNILGSMVVLKDGLGHLFTSSGSSRNWKQLYTILKQHGLEPKPPPPPNPPIKVTKLNFAILNTLKIIAHI